MLFLTDAKSSNARFKRDEELARLAGQLRLHVYCKVHMDKDEIDSAIMAKGRRKAISLMVK